MRETYRWLSFMSARLLPRFVASAIGAVAYHHRSSCRNAGGNDSETMACGVIDCFVSVRPIPFLLFPFFPSHLCIFLFSLAIRCDRDSECSFSILLADSACVVVSLVHMLLSMALSLSIPIENSALCDFLFLFKLSFSSSHTPPFSVFISFRVILNLLNL
mmetsp:Transcript_6501/g.12127  ORF Transcript_6501/g.12127 Transcript_6501/m.12127 type:complete len:160 (+) Transcript_6501:163-642(+)